ncbi:hypothetical protein GU926_00315 [Nibribacter ruber]|uniref:STAS/SEC14 domain-containing protein n=1 Tax=Nibribacter ruber TaxID=2698458 RepID=A0A6P1NVG0_9BACT|nr:hypothetical protein GU926_00315 [Nibribacter ruber]
MGDKTWEQTLATAIKPFTTAQVKFFPAEQQTEAMAWVQS